MHKGPSKNAGTLEHCKTLLGLEAARPAAAALDDGTTSTSGRSSSPWQQQQQQQNGGTASSYRGQQQAYSSSSTTSHSRVSSRHRHRHHSTSRSSGGGGGRPGCAPPPTYYSQQQQQQQHQENHLPEAHSLDLIDCLGGSCSGGGGGTSAGGTDGGRSQRLRDIAVHSGAVTAIVITGGRAYTAGGSSPSNAALHIWDAGSCLLLNSISRHSAAFNYKAPTTSMTLVQWASTRRGAGAAAAAAVTAPSLQPQHTISSSYPSTVLSSADGGVGLDGSGSSSNLQAPSLQQQHGAPGTPVAAAAGTSAGSALSALPDWHLVTGHADGAVVVWDRGADTLRPVLLILPAERSAKAVRAVVVLQELGLICCGHANGKVYMRRLDRSVPLLPREDRAIPRWAPATFALQAHRLGLTRMAGHGHLLVTSGKTGSIKLWPETTLRCLASEAGIQLPFSRGNPVSEAINSLLFSRGAFLTHRDSGGSSALLQAPSLQQQQQQYSGAPQAAAVAAGSIAARQQQPTEQQPPQQLQQQQQGEGGANGQQPQQQQQEQGGSSGRWPSDDLRSTNWVIEWGALHVDSRRKAIGRGSYGRVELGCYNQCDVAVKILTEPGSSNSCASGGGTAAEHSAVTWDRVRLEGLRHEVGILSTLRHPNVVLFMGVCLSPPAVVTEYCPLRSLYDVVRKANHDAALAGRLTWQRRLRMALDAAKGMVHLHSHKPTILHRDLKSPNLFVMTSYMVKVGDFNLSRYMALDSVVVQSSLELNPRWSAPEVIGSGFYSTAADVFSFGVVLWELLTWQEPWEEEGLSSYQIMTAVQQEGLRPQLPPWNQLPGQVGPQAAASAYVALLEACWAQEISKRPSFEQVVNRLKEILLITGPNMHPGTVARAAAAAGADAPPPGPPRGVSEGAALAAAAAAAAAATAAAEGAAPGAAVPGHLRCRSEVVGGAAAAEGPEIADLLQLGQGEDDLPGPSAPRPPAAALPRIPGTAAEGGGGARAGGVGLPPKAPARISGGGTSNGGGVGPAAAAAAGGASRSSSPFASQAAQSGSGSAAVAGVQLLLEPHQQQQPTLPPSLPVGLPQVQPPQAPPYRSSSGGGGGGAAGSGSSTPSHPAAGGRSPMGGIRPSPFASSAAAAALVGEGCSSSSSSGGGGGGDGDGAIHPGPAAGSCGSGMAGGQGSGSSGGRTSAARPSADGVAGSGRVTSPCLSGAGVALPVVNAVDVADRLQAAVDAASAVDPTNRRKPRPSSGATAAAAAAAAAAGPESNGVPPRADGSGAGGSGSAGVVLAATLHDLISLDSGGS